MRKSVFIIVLVCTVFMFITLAFGDTKKPYIAYYELHNIKSGDTLWSIAQEYNSTSVSTEKYVSIIMDFNNIKSDNIISGQNILVPVYKIDE